MFWERRGRSRLCGSLLRWQTQTSHLFQLQAKRGPRNDTPSSIDVHEGQPRCALMRSSACSPRMAQRPRMVELAALSCAPQTAWHGRRGEGRR